MRAAKTIRFWIVLGLATMTGSVTRAQLKIGDDTSLNFNANASVGYVRSWDGTDSNSAAYGFNGNLTGFYHDPRFLSFTANPYLNQSNLNSTSSSNSLASGIYSQANFLSASKTPMTFSYSRDYNRDSTSTLPGSGIGYITHGNGQGFGASASYLPENWPSITASFAHSSSDYEVDGQPGTGNSHLNTVSLNSRYDLANTILSASYSQTWVNSQTPIFGSVDSMLNQNTDSGNFFASASHSFGTRAGLHASYSRSSVHGEYADTRLDETYDNLYGNANLKVTSQLSLGAYFSYSSNLSGQYFTNVITGAGAQKGAPVTSTGESTTSGSTRYTNSFLSYGADAGYQVLSCLSLIGRVEHRIQGQAGGLPDFTSTEMVGTAVCNHKLWGGGLGLSGSASYSFAPLYTLENSSGNMTEKQTGQTSFLGESANVSYSHPLGAWNGSITGNYSHGLTTFLVGYLQTSYGGGANITRTLKYWAISASAGISKSHVDASSLSDTNSENFSGTITHRNTSLTGSYSKSQGNALQVGSSIIPVGGSTAGVENLLIQYNGQSYGIGASWRPKRRWTLVGNYSHVDYSSLNPLIGANSVRTRSTQMSFRSEYSVRQLYIVTGYSRVDQGSSQVGTIPYLYNTFYFGIQRQFNFF